MWQRLDRSKKETDIQADYRKHVCRSHPDHLVFKLNPFGIKGWPDTITLLHRYVFFIEFKRDGKDARKLQKHYHGLIKSLGFSCYVVDNLEEAKAIYDREAETNAKLKNRLEKLLK